MYSTYAIMYLYVRTSCVLKLLSELYSVDSAGWMLSPLHIICSRNISSNRYLIAHLTDFHLSKLTINIIHYNFRFRFSKSVHHIGPSGSKWLHERYLELRTVYCRTFLLKPMNTILMHVTPENYITPLRTTTKKKLPEKLVLHIKEQFVVELKRFPTITQTNLVYWRNWLTHLRIKLPKSTRVRLILS